MSRMRRTESRSPESSSGRADSFWTGRWLSSEQCAAFRAEGTTAFRLCSASGGWVEQLGDDILISFKDEAVRDILHEELRARASAENAPCQRVFGKFIPRQNEDRQSPVLLEGDAALPLETVVEEAGMRFGIDFAAGYSAGLFIDQRANRAFVRRLRAHRLLNTFAYTCSFSAAAALGGAETVCVDLSKKSLDRGRLNFALNGLDAASHHFIADDVLEVLPRLARRGERFDCIILDPPTFSRGNKGRRFQVERDFEHLLAAALEIAAPRCRILLSTNCARLSRRALEQTARHGLKIERRSAAFHREPELPDVPAEAGAQTLWLLLNS
jgi:23S rRNA (cytosine1962-C5)-methyltransferase